MNHQIFVDEIDSQELVEQHQELHGQESHDHHQECFVAYEYSEVDSDVDVGVDESVDGASVDGNIDSYV